jgi:Ca-activated chloride channel homolog
LKARIFIFPLILLSLPVFLQAQKANALIRSGNRFYKQKQFDQSLSQYQKATQAAPDNPAANYNLGNAEFRKNNFDDAVKSYEAGIEHSTDKTVKEKGLYNKGVALIKQQKLDESIEAWKNSLLLDPADSDARENLEKALLEKRKQSKPQQNEQKEQQKQQEQPKPQPSKLSKQQVEQLLKALAQKEKEVQDKMNQNKAKSLSQPDKDW